MDKIKKLIGHCEICKGVLGTHDTYEHVYHLYVDLAEMAEKDKELAIKLIPTLNKLYKYLEEGFLSTLWFTSEAEKNKIRGIGQIATNIETQ